MWIGFCVSQMPEITDAVSKTGPEMSSLMENLQKHKLNAATRQNVINSSSSIKETSSTSTQQASNCAIYWKHESLSQKNDFELLIV